jgi:hypothetical protein
MATKIITPEPTKHAGFSNYASANSSWFSTSLATKPAKPKIVAKKTTYPFFIELSNFTSDPYWKEVLIALGNGKFPLNISFENGMMVYTKKTTIRTQEGGVKLELDATFMQTSDPTSKQKLGTEMFAKIKQFLLKHAAMMSDLDKMEVMREITAKTNKRKNISEDVRKYAEEKKRTLNLNNDDVEKLITLINLSLLTKVLSNNDFSYEEKKASSPLPSQGSSPLPSQGSSPLPNQGRGERKISFIDGLFFDNKLGIFYINPEKIKKIKKTPKSTAKVKPSDAIERWNSFVTNINIKTTSIKIHGMTINNELTNQAHEEYSVKTSLTNVPV